MTALKTPSTLSLLKNGLIVSCQPRAGSALDRPSLVAAMARVAEENGAVGVRIRGARNIGAVRRAVQVPVIGIEKISYPGSEVYITPTLESVRRVHRAGAQIIALDGTGRRRPGHQSLANIIKTAKSELGALIMADIATFRQGLEAARLGVDLVGTTLCGYTEETRHCQGPALDLAAQLVRELNIPVVLEGRLHEPDQVRKAFDLGVHSVVVGTAITDLDWLIQRFISACPKSLRGSDPKFAEENTRQGRPASRAGKRKRK